MLQNEVARIVGSATFGSSPRHRRFLEYLVAHAVRGDGTRLKEMTLGIDVFDRPASHFDPQRDTIVRVEARRLRARLSRYYREEGADSLVEIVLPIGSYTPTLNRRPDALHTASLVVLPIVDRSGVELAADFREDVFDALLEAVARVPGFKVIARNSAMRAGATATASDCRSGDGDDVADQSIDKDLALRLGVALLLHGILERDEKLLRLRLRLVRGITGERLWTGSWTLAIASGFAARDALTARIVHDVQRELPSRLPPLPVQTETAERPANDEPAEPIARDPGASDATIHAATIHGSIVHGSNVHASNIQASIVHEPIDERARDLVDRGRYLMRHGAVDAYPQALQRFRAATAIAPRYAAAHFGIARSLSYLLGMTQIAPHDGIDEARNAALEALALDPRHGDAASILAGLQQRFDHDWHAARAGYLSAIALSPGSLYVHFNYAFGLMFSGRFDEAESELRLARELDPLDLGQRATQALLEFYRRDYARADAILTALLDDEPRHLLARSLRGALFLLTDRPDAALAEYRIADRLSPDISIGRVGIAQAHALAGRHAEAKADRATLIRAFEGRYLSPYQLALVDLRRGDIDSAFALLGRAALDRDPNFIAVLVDPSLDTLRADARFAALLEAHGLDRVLPVDCTTA